MATPGLPPTSLVLTITRQDAMPGEVNDQQLFIFWAERGWESGWYLSDQPFNTDAEKAGAVVHMRFTGTDEHDLATETLHGIEVKQYASWPNEQEVRIKDLEAQVPVISLTIWYQDKLRELGKLFNSWYYQFHEVGPLVDKNIQDGMP